MSETRPLEPASGIGRPDAPFRGVKLGYATNAFPGETLDQLLESFCGPLKKVGLMVGREGTSSPEAPVVPPGERLGLEIRLSATVAATIAADPVARERVKEALEQCGFEALTLNGFSPRDFHSRRVKEDAYRPTWTEPARAEYTRMIAEFFAEVLPPRATGSISTSPGSYKSCRHDDELFCSLAETYAQMAVFLGELEARTTRRVLLCLEPEPACSIETTDELLSFFENHLLTTGKRRLMSVGGRNASQAEELLRRHIGVTFDTAHLSVEFEDLAVSVRRIAGAGIRIGKVHATSALKLDSPGANPAAMSKLAEFSRSPYMHQSIGVDSTGAVCFRAHDLDELFSQPARLDSCAELRTHFHLPLFLERLGPLSTTGAEALAATRMILSEEISDTVILETYTWNMLGLLPEIGATSIETAVAGELQWARERLLRN